MIDVKYNKIDTFTQVFYLCQFYCFFLKKLIEKDFLEKNVKKNCRRKSSGIHYNQNLIDKYTLIIGESG